MLLQQLAYLADIIGVILVVASLIYVGREMRQNTEMIQAQMNQSRAENAMNVAQAIYNSDYMPEIFVLLSADQQLTDIQVDRLRNWLRGFNRNLENQLWQCSNGFLGNNILQSVRIAVQEQIARYVIMRELWESTKHYYSEDYIKLVDKEIADYFKN